MEDVKIKLYLPEKFAIKSASPKYGYMDIPAGKAMEMLSQEERDQLAEWKARNSTTINTDAPVRTTEDLVAVLRKHLEYEKWLREQEAKKINERAEDLLAQSSYVTSDGNIDWSVSNFLQRHPSHPACEELRARARRDASKRLDEFLSMSDEGIDCSSTYELRGVTSFGILADRREEANRLAERIEAIKDRAAQRRDQERIEKERAKAEKEARKKLENDAFFERAGYGLIVREGYNYDKALIEHILQRVCLADSSGRETFVASLTSDAWEDFSSPEIRNSPSLEMVKLQVKTREAMAALAKELELPSHFTIEVDPVSRAKINGKVHTVVPIKLLDEDRWVGVVLLY